MTWDEEIIGTNATAVDTEAFMGAMQATFDVKPAYFRGDGGRPLCSGYTHTRMMLRKRLYLNNILCAEKNAFDKIRDYAKQVKVGAIVSTMFSQWDFDAEKFGVAKTFTTLTSAVDLTKTEEQLLAGMEKPFRNGISKAKRSGLVFERSEDYDVFYELYLASHAEAKKDGEEVAPYSKKRFMSLLLPVAKAGCASFFTVEKGGLMLNGAIISHFNGKAIYWHGGMIQEHKNLCGGNLLHWGIMSWLKSAGYKTYDLGGIATGEIGRHKQGVNHFKLSMGGSPKEYFMGKITM